jgi:hypothetical protein
MQYIRGRIGDDRDAILAVQFRPHPGLAERPSPALSRGKGRSEDAASECAMDPASKRTRVTDAQAECSSSTVTSEDGQQVSDRGHSDTGSSEYSPVSDAGQKSREITGSSEYSPVSDAEQEPREVKTEAHAEVLHMARFVQALTKVINRRRS